MATRRAAPRRSLGGCWPSRHKRPVARLAIRARSAGLSASDVDAALTRRSLIVTWLNRGTLHLVRTEDYWWLHPLTTPQLRTGNSRRLAQEGVPPQDADRAVAAVRAALAAAGPLTRPQLRERVAAARVADRGSGDGAHPGAGQNEDQHIDTASRELEVQQPAAQALQAAGWRSRKLEPAGPMRLCWRIRDIRFR